MSTGRLHHYAHLLQVYKEFLQPLTLYTSFHDSINVYSCRSGADNSRGQNFDVNRNLLSLQSKSLWSLILYNFFHDFIHVYTCSPGDEIFMSTGTSCHFGHLLQVLKKISLKSDFMQFFSWFYTCIYPWGRGRQPPGDKVLMSTEMSCHFIYMMQVLKKCLWSLILYNLFYDLIHVYSPGAGADSPQGTKFGCQQKGIITLPICCKFQRNLFEVWFYTFVFMI